MPEREIKLLMEPEAPMPAVTDLLDGFGDVAAEELDQDAVYYDTPDLRLIRAGVSLRYRSDDGWTVKIPQPREGATFVRDEHRFGGDPGPPPSEAVDLVRAWSRGAPLSEVAEIHTHRRKLRVFDGDGRAVGELDDDDVRGLADHSVHFREIEFETTDAADPKLIGAVVKRLERAGARTNRPLPKVARVLGEPALRPPDLDPSAALGRRSSIGDLVRATISSATRRLVAHDPVIRASEEPEGVHQARVATRRLRSDLRTLRPVLDREWSESLREELRWLGEQLGRVRDYDVLIELTQSKAAALPPGQHARAMRLVDQLRDARARGRDALLESMRSPRYTALLDRLVAASRSPRLVEDSNRRAVKVVVKLTAKPWSRLEKYVDRLPSSPTDAELHESRKRAKQARYAFEMSAAVAGKEPRRVAKRLAALQEQLGAHQDAVVAAAWLHDAAVRAEDRETAFIAGEIAESCAADRRRIRAEWKRVWTRARRAHRNLKR